MNGSAWRGSQPNFEIPLPFGYHMDLDFVRFCSEDTSAVSEETLDRLRDLRRQRREDEWPGSLVVGFVGDLD